MAQIMKAQFIEQICNGIQQIIKETGFSDELKSVLQELSICLKKLISVCMDAVLSICCGIKAFINAWLCFDINNAMKLPCIDKRLADLVKLIGEINKSASAGAGDCQSNEVLIFKLEEAKDTAEDIFTKLKDAVNNAIKDNSWVFFNRIVGSGVGGGMVGIGVELAVLGLAGGVTCGACVAAGGVVGVVLGAAAGGGVYKRTDNRIKFEAKSRANELKIQLRQAISSAQQLGVYYPQHKKIPWLIKELEDLQKRVTDYEPGKKIQNQNCAS